ncbi:hypothetical protein SAMN04487765_3599 [Tenacibaculum sp. MAR_2010_89]|uniref:contractile injection system tape measure protein n=1 Tax=Tenacibaculum sp. MAR_2010_89 TaxID=1250198 RepID=UPI0008957084|nr:contractile injection system tape measure protein [Tenacibaculum sp. MAR_2010_89]SEE65123.1 hypothetical protein SAMN04487765_3599 [Tenacibaculum sp. MAR_2010_89]
MLSTSNHIIARCSWNTFFDEKEKGVELQNKLSVWSEHHMPKEVNAVFNSICANGQTLKIKTLKLDLGVVNYDNLTEELALKIREQLRLQLQDILMYPDKHGQSIQILREENTDVNIIKYFLLQGIMSWNYQEVKGTIHQIFTDQLSNNRQEVINMIQAVGTKEYVRRRISWQFKEASIKKIIESLEQSNHSYIIDFSDEFIKIQERETIVKSGIHDFKKNLWFWILNYLFEERGTMFNKITFVKSNIEQMANHFNIEYKELFALIEDAVYKVNENSYVKTNLILILSIISQKESKTLNTEFSNEKQLEKYWQTLHNYFQSPNTRVTTFQKQHFKELIHTLSEVTPSRFKNILNTVKNKVFNWRSIVNDLDVVAIKILLNTLSPHKGDIIYDEVISINKIALHKHFNLKETWVLVKSFQFLKEYDSVTHTKTKFLDFLLNEIAALKNLTKIKVIEKLTKTTLKSDQKNTKTIYLFKHLNKIHRREIIKGLPVFSEDKVVKVLKEFTNNSLFKLDNTLTESYYKTIRVWFKKQPIIVWNLLKEHNNQAVIQKIIPELFNDEGIIRILLKKIYPDHYQLIKKIKRSIGKANVNKESYKILSKIQQSILTESIGVLSFNKSQNLISFISLLFKNLKVKEDLSDVKNFENTLNYILKELHKKTKKELLFNKDELKLLVNEVKQTSTLDLVLKYIKDFKYKHQQVANLLRNIVYEKKYNSNTFIKNEQIIANYLLPDAFKIKKEITLAYLRKKNIFEKKHTVTVLKKIINEHFWLCIADYLGYRGNKATFQELLKKAISYTLDEDAYKSNDEIRYELTSNNEIKETTISNLYVMPKEHLVSCLREVFENDEKGKDEIRLYKNNIPLNNLLLFCLEEYPEEICLLIREFPTEKLIRILKKNIPFKQFTVLISKEKSTLNLVIYAIASLHDLLLHVKKEELGSKIENEFWKSTLVILKKNTNAINTLESLIEVILNELAAINILNILKEENIYVPQLLKEILITKNSTFELLISEKRTKTIFKELEECYQKNKLTSLSKSLFLETKIPSWFTFSKSITVKILIGKVLRGYPLEVLSILRRNNLSKTQITNLLNVIDTTQFLSVLKQLYPTQQNQFTALQRLFMVLDNNVIKEISPIIIREVLLEKLIKSWTNSNWRLLATASIWRELLWELSVKRNIQEEKFIQAISAIKDQFPTPLKIAFERTEEINKNKKLNTYNMSVEKEKINGVGIPIHNAGLVLLNSYYLMLLDRLNLITNEKFNTKEDQLKAVHYLQYTVTGMAQTEESLLSLNKLLCGIPLNEPITDRIEITVKEEDLINGLITAAISYWPAIGNTTVNGFRGNWLVRDGLLREEDDRWELIIEKRPYDVLLIKSPFSFSIIKLPWMVKPLHVTWSF